MAKGHTNRRQALQAIGAAGVSALVGCGDAQNTESTLPAGGSSNGNAGSGTGGAGGFGNGTASGGTDQTATGGTSQTATGGSSAGAGDTGGTAGATGGLPIPADPPPISCVLVPSTTEGPYFADDDEVKRSNLDRSDIRANFGSTELKPGVPLRLVLWVYRIDGDSCAPLPDAVVDVWHCDALGNYSAFDDVVMDPPLFHTRGQDFLRGFQRSNQDGAVQFMTIYPGWYPIRAIHIHFKVRVEGLRPFTSQLFFDEKINDEVLKQAPYNSVSGERVRNEDDGIMSPELLLDVSRDGDGYLATFSLGLRVT